MAEVTGYTANFMEQMKKANITGARLEVVGADHHLILVPEGFATEPLAYPEIDVGNVRGIIGPEGPMGEVSDAELNAAISAAVAAAHANGAISTAQLADLAVTNPKLASDSVSNAKIQTGAVTNAKLGASSVTADKIANEAVTNAKLGASSVTVDKIANDAVTDEKIGSPSSGGAVYAGGHNQLHWARMGKLVSVWTSGDGVTAQTIPSGFRPQYQVMVPCMNAYSGLMTGAVMIATTGVMTFYYPEGAGDDTRGCFSVTYMTP